MSEDLSALWDQAKPAAPPHQGEDLSALWEQAKPATTPAAAAAPTPPPPGNANVPVGLLTGDPSTDARISQSLAATGNAKPITRRDVASAAAIGASLMLPELAPGLAGVAAGGALYGAGTSQGKTVAEVGKDAAMGGAGATLGFGALKGLGAGLGKLGEFASRKAGAAVGEAAGKANAEASSALASEVSRLGGFSQDLNRKIEWVIRLTAEEQSGAISPVNKLALDLFKKTPEFGDVVNKAAERVLETAPGAVARTTAQQAKVGQLSADLPQTVAERTGQLTSGKEAWEQVKARALRYGLPGLGGALASQLGLGWEGVGMGAIAGAGLRPMMHSLIRMRNNPAVRAQAWGALEGLAGAASKTGSTSGGARAAQVAGEMAAEPLGLHLAPAGASTGSESADPGQQAPSTPSASHQDTTGGTPGRPSITGGDRDGAEHFQRWMRDPAYQDAMRGGR